MLEYGLAMPTNIDHAASREYARILYTWKFLLDKNFTRPSYLHIAEQFGGKNFIKIGKGRHILQSFTQDKISMIKFLLVRASCDVYYSMSTLYHFGVQNHKF